MSSKCLDICPPTPAYLLGDYCAITTGGNNTAILTECCGTQLVETYNIDGYYEAALGEAGCYAHCNVTSQEVDSVETCVRTAKGVTGCLSCPKSARNTTSGGAKGFAVSRKGKSDKMALLALGIAVVAAVVGIE